MDRIASKVEAVAAETVLLRRDFHRHPELGMQEFRTGSIVAEYLEACGLEVRRVNTTGVSGLLKGARPGPTILLRADMDALPIREETGLPFASINDGIMHACGHDAHTAMLLTAAKILADEVENLHGNVKFAFEPNEENVGALGMIEEGILEEPTVSACLGVHVWTPLESGKVGVKAGPLMAGMKHFSLTIYGRGGHTATPHSAIDPVLTAASVIQGVQAVQTRELDALREPCVIMFGTISGGTAANVIPDTVSVSGTIRYLFQGDDESEGSPLARFRRVVHGICTAHRTTYDLEYSHGHPTLVNHPALTAMLTTQVLPSLHTPLAAESLVSLAGEDFSEFAARVPSVFYFLGAAKTDANYPHHHPSFDIDERVLKHGVEIHVRTVLRFFQNVRDGVFTP